MRLFVLTLCAMLPLNVSGLSAQDHRAPTARVDYLTFAQGAIPLRVEGTGSENGATLRHAVEFVDGNPGGFTFVNRANSETDTEIVYELPAETVFDRFAVPEVLETPSPSQTFVRDVEVFGSAEGPDGPWILLASASLETHESRGMETELILKETMPVRWIRLRLVGGIEMLRDQMFLEFGEIIGNGTQETPDLVDHFVGTWWDRGVRVQLWQNGPTVAGCYDSGGELTGTVTGNILRAVGIDPSDGVESHFILGVDGDGGIRGVRSTNGAPFTLYQGAKDTQGREIDCPGRRDPVLGCGSVIHGISFDFDSAVIRPESAPILDQLFQGLQADSQASIAIEGHTSSEGTDTYNLDLSERRAQAVVVELTRRGTDPARLDAVGRGEASPIATNDNESGRSLNRRVEVVCR